MRNVIIATFIILWCVNAWAIFDSELNHSFRCVKLFRHYEHKYKIPNDALHSISLKESGRMHSTNKIKMVWPWTVNIEGKGYHFDSKYEAVNFVKRELERGKTSIDVGCMQVNLKQHPKAFESIEEAFDPHSNVNYGASFLRAKYEKLGSWSKAIAHYHSATPALGIPYKDSVIKIASNINKYKVAFSNSAKFSSNLNDYKTDANLYYKPKGLNRKSMPRRYRSNMMVHIPSSPKNLICRK